MILESIFFFFRVAPFRPDEEQRDFKTGKNGSFLKKVLKLWFD